MHSIIIGKTDQLAQAIIFATYIPDDRAKNYLYALINQICLVCTYLILCLSYAR